MPPTIHLTDPQITPTPAVIENALGSDVFAVYHEMMEIISSDEFQLNPEWNYYKDGKAWLCKVTFRKKTIFWLSVWEKKFNTGFYFTENTRSGIFDLPVSDEVKTNFQEMKTVGKLFPLLLEIDKKEQLEDLKAIIIYKKSLK